MLGRVSGRETRKQGGWGGVWLEVGDTDQGMLCPPPPPRRKTEGSQPERMWAGKRAQNSGYLYLRTLAPPRDGHAGHLVQDRDVQ